MARSAERQSGGVLHTFPQPLHGYAMSSASIGDSGKPADDSMLIKSWVARTQVYCSSRQQTLGLAYR